MRESIPKCGVYNLAWWTPVTSHQKNNLHKLPHVSFLSHSHFLFLAGPPDQRASRLKLSSKSLQTLVSDWRNKHASFSSQNKRVVVSRFSFQSQLPSQRFFHFCLPLQRMKITPRNYLGCRIVWCNVSWEGQVLDHLCQSDLTFDQGRGHGNPPCPTRGN